jgi:hypothetical protein
LNSKIIQQIDLNKKAGPDADPLLVRNALFLLDDRVHRADFDTFTIISALAGIDDVDFITHGDCAGGADWFAGAARDAFFSNYMSHFLQSFRL